MTAFRLYQLYRRAGHSPCRAYQLANNTAPGLLPSALCYAAAVVLVVGSVALIVR